MTTKSEFPRRVMTGPIRKAPGRGIRGTGYNYRMMSGQALAQYQAATERLGSK